MTQPQFEQLYNERRAQEIKVGFFKKTFPLVKSKVTKKATYKDDISANGVPSRVIMTPPISKKVFDTNMFTKLCQAVWQFYLGTELKRISSEGSYRNGQYIKSPNKGISDLMGAYQGKIYFIEIKQPKEKQLESQVKFQKWSEDGGIRYCIVRGWDDIYSLVTEIKEHATTTTRN